MIFANNLVIPDSIKLHLPKDTYDTFKHTEEFELYKSIQPGIYNYKFCVTELGDGSTYLKAYEVTENYRLSKDNLIEQSYKSVWYINKIFCDSGNIAIYEGDWGQPYAARFEVWFKPSDGSGERKLIEKIYKIEGWQR